MLYPQLEQGLQAFKAGGEIELRANASSSSANSIWRYSPNTAANSSTVIKMINLIIRCVSILTDFHTD